MVKVCGVCGEEFIPRHNAQKYCCDHCREKAYKDYRKEYGRQYFQKNKEKTKEARHIYQKEYYRKNKDMYKVRRKKLNDMVFDEYLQYLKEVVR